MRTKEYVWCQNKDNMGGATGYILNLKGNLTDSTVWNTGETGDMDLWWMSVCKLLGIFWIFTQQET